LTHNRAVAPAAPCLLLFARAPESGRVKTRLEPALGTGGASRLYRAFLEDSARRYGPPSPWSSVLCADPDASSPALRRLFGGGWRLEAQAAGDLGDRLEAAFRSAFARGAPAAAALGSDHPALSRGRLQELFDRLADGDAAVLIPAEDGGYCAIGLAAAAPLEAIFRSMPWSTPAVLGRTLGRLRESGVEPTLLAPSYDVDRPEDLERFREELSLRDSEDADYPRATAAALAAIRRDGDA
jgi:rSAM/selenodomain-associated transferase 1